MFLVKKSQTHKFVASKSTTLFEYLMSDKSLGGAIAEINGNYPETGLAQNLKCDEIVYVIKGQGYILVDAKKTKISTGDTILVKAKEKFQWLGVLSLYIVCTPKFDPKQHKIID